MGGGQPAWVPPAEAGPVVPKAGAVPGEHRRWLHKDQHLPPGPEQPITRAHARAPARSLAEGQLVSQRHNLQLQGDARAEKAGDEREERTNDGRHEAGSFP